MNWRLSTAVFITITLILTSGNFVSARTQLDSLENFLDLNHSGEDGFRDAPGLPITVSSTADALEVSNILGIEVNNTIDILYFYQRSQNPDGGFGENPDASSNLNTTMEAVRGLKYLPVNSSQLHNWKIFEYVNETASDLLYENVSKTSGYVQGLKSLDAKLMDIWIRYITSSYSLGFFPNLESDAMIQALLDLQLSNGSYSNFRVAANAVVLLDLLGQSPNDPDLATKFLLAHITSKGSFSFTGQGDNSLEATYLGIRALNALDSIWKLNEKDDVTKFVLSLQKSNSGFGRTTSSSPTVHDSWLAVLTLSYLNELDELEAPDVLQTVGFVDYPWIAGLIPLILLIRRRKS